jgi:hypothetical protein
VIVQTAGGSVEIAVKGLACSCRLPAHRPSGRRRFHRHVQSQVIASIELPSVGTTRTVNGVI